MRSTGPRAVLYEGPVRGLCPHARKTHTMALPRPGRPSLGFDCVIGVADFRSGARQGSALARPARLDHPACPSLKNVHVVGCGAERDPGPHRHNLHCAHDREPREPGAVTGPLPLGQHLLASLVGSGQASCTSTLSASPRRSLSLRLS